MASILSESSLVAQPALYTLGILGWRTADARDEWAHGASTLGREHTGQVVLEDRLMAALRRLNPGLPGEAYQRAIAEILRDRSQLSLAAANRELYHLLKHCVLVEFERDGRRHSRRLHLVDWRHPGRNDWFAVTEFTVTGDMYKRRVDLVGFVNGLPWLLCEFKRPDHDVQEAYDRNLRDYRGEGDQPATVPQLFWHNALLVLSNGSDARLGTVTSLWEHFAEWRKVADENEQGIVSLDTLLRGTCRPDRLLDLVENYTAFEEARGGLIKLLARNHQYLGVENALAALRSLGANQGRLGVFWHTQGSGKSVSMLFFSQKVLRRVPGNWTFVVVTDRRELDEQIYRKFRRSGVITTDEVHATSVNHLRQLLREDHRYIFTLIQKFQAEPGQRHPVLSDRDDIIVMVDEAHRSQYDTLAANMRAALPRAAFIAFTGTPLIIGEERTRQVFGEYVSVYDFQESVADGATVPLYYESRIPEVEIVNERLNEELWALIEEAELDDRAERRLRHELASEYQLITREERLDRVAEDIAYHFLHRGFLGKGMVVCIDKATAVRMYDKVQAHIDAYIERMRRQLASAPRGDQQQELRERLAFAASTDMAVVVSPEQNEIAKMRERGVEIGRHRERMSREDLAERFKDPDDPFRLVFVCAMWMTGFDAPACSTIYLDKPMRNHTLMQTIARANRVFPEKAAGVIVDYVGVFRNLQQALAIYGQGPTGETPVVDKDELLEELRRSLHETEAFCANHGVDIAEVADVPQGFPVVQAIERAEEALLATEDIRKTFVALATHTYRLYKAVLPDPRAQDMAAHVRLLHLLAGRLNAYEPTVDPKEIRRAAEQILDRSIVVKSGGIREAETDHVDLSQFDLEALAKSFQQEKQNTQARKLESLLRARVHAMVDLNPTRYDYLERFEALIEAYNAGYTDIERLFQQLLQFAHELDAEEQRHIQEQLTEEELAVYDLLLQDGVRLSKSEREGVKNVTRALLDRLKQEKLVLDWRRRAQGRATVKLTIEEMLDTGLPDSYGDDAYGRACEAVFQHVFEKYRGPGESVYAVA